MITVKLPSTYHSRELNIWLDNCVPEYSH